MIRTAKALVEEAKRSIREASIAEVATPGRPAVLIDVRERAEFEAGHLAGAIGIPRGVLEFQIEDHPALQALAGPTALLRDTPITLYCRSGARSALAAVSLGRMGFEHVESMAGGITAWREAGKPVTTD